MENWLKQNRKRGFGREQQQLTWSCTCKAQRALGRRQEVVSVAGTVSVMVVDLLGVGRPEAVF